MLFEASKADPEQFVECSKTAAWSFSMESQKLLTERKIFQDEIFSGS
jgi:hypothetical protein